MFYKTDKLSKSKNSQTFSLSMCIQRSLWLSLISFIFAWHTLLLTYVSFFLPLFTFSTYYYYLCVTPTTNGAALDKIVHNQLPLQDEAAEPAIPRHDLSPEPGPSRRSGVLGGRRRPVPRPPRPRTTAMTRTKCIELLVRRQTEKKNSVERTRQFRETAITLPSRVARDNYQ